MNSMSYSLVPLGLPTCFILWLNKRRRQEKISMYLTAQCSLKVITGRSVVTTMNVKKILASLLCLVLSGRYDYVSNSSIERTNSLSYAR